MQFNKRLWKPGRASLHRTQCALERRRRRRRSSVGMRRMSTRTLPQERPDEQHIRRYSSFFSNGQKPVNPRLHPSAKLYHYVIPFDRNVAPCIPVRGGPLSLALCKLAIREKAQVGDWVTAALPKGDYHQVGLVRYVFQVTRKMTVLEFHGNFGGGRRRDQIYRVQGGTLVHKDNVLYHNAGTAAQRNRDQRDDKKGHALLSDHFCAIDGAKPLAHPLPDFCLPQKHGRGYRSVELTIPEQIRLCTFVADNLVSSVAQ